jgi:predicted GTPase
MSKNFAAVADEALQLPQGDQLRLARTLLEHTEATGDINAETAWEKEIERRIEMVDSGLAKGRSYVEVLRDIDARLGR